MSPRFLFYFILIVVGCQACATLKPFNPQGTADTTPVPWSGPVLNATPIQYPLPTIWGSSAAVMTLEPPAPDPTQAPNPPAGATRWFLPQAGMPSVLPNYVHPGLGCDWQGVGGQVVNHDGEPLASLVVALGGEFNGQVILVKTMTGSAADWGQGGFEFTLATGSLQGQGDLWVQVSGLDNQPVSDPIRFSTQGDCEHNLTVVNFVEAVAESSTELFFPVIYQNNGGSLP